MKEERNSAVSKEKARECNGLEMLDCGFNISRIMKHDPVTAEKIGLQNCQQECPFECHYDKYTNELSYASFPSKITSKFWDHFFRGHSEHDHGDKPKVSRKEQEEKNAERNRMNLASLVVYFTSTRYTKMTQEKSFDMYQLFSDLGGTLGLWVGSSMLTIR